MNEELPAWPGAAVVYHRAAIICTALNAAEYHRQLAAKKGKRLRRFIPCAEAEAIIRAMNRGDEEALKSACVQYIDLWSSRRIAA